MLVLTRKRLETIKIGNDIVVKVIQTGKGTVKLGIEAPGDVRVLMFACSGVSSPLTRRFRLLRMKPKKRSWSSSWSNSTTFFRKRDTTRWMSHCWPGPLIELRPR